jgi:hypothetical protein
MIDKVFDSVMADDIVEKIEKIAQVFAAQVLDDSEVVPFPD